MSLSLEKRQVTALVLVMGAAAIAGFLTGTRPPSEDGTLGEEGTEVAASRARSYGELRDKSESPNARLYPGEFSRLGEGKPGLLDPVEQTEEQKQAALERRRERRAYAGAPPTVPHPVQEQAASACLTCHETGGIVAGKKAPAMSHRPMTMCVQCHAIERKGDGFVEEERPPLTDNLFVGVQEEPKGSRAWEGAPPTIPHSTLLRENCMSCHGVLGDAGLRTPHPAQSNCVQCHAPSAEHDEGRPPGLTP